MRSVDLTDPKYYINRQLSWLEFNYRVLEEAKDPSNPLLERLKFLTIFATNLDEFFMIRVANLRELEVAGVTEPGPDGLRPLEQLDAISARCHELCELHARLLHDEILPALQHEGLRLHLVKDLDPSQLETMARLFHRELFPVLTPMTVDPSHPFPHLRNLSLNLIVTFERPSGMDDEEIPFAIVEIPSVLDRLIALEDQPGAYLLLDDLILQNAGELFSGLRVTGAWTFRVTRNADLSIEEQEAENLLHDIERELRNRSFRRVVRLEVSDLMPNDVLENLIEGLEVPRREVYPLRAPLHAPSLLKFYGADRPELKEVPFNPRLSPRLNTSQSIFSVVREQDLLLHHPYESFSTVVELLQYAAHDKRVLAIKLTLYRTSGDSVIIQALKDAAENGKQVTAVVELKARFDEKNNIVWAKELERAGVHVTYGIVGLKTHCKATLVVRREGGRIRRYMHFATGNYNSTTARFYTDLGLLTCDELLGEDASQLFNVLTGYDARTISDILHHEHARPHFHKLLVAPFDLRERIIELIDQEIQLHTADEPGLIQIKVNGLSEPTIIQALYRASMAGVRVRLCIRGICCLRPGIPGISENITVTSVVDRFLEHPRIIHFGHGGAHLLYLGSADLMPRNLYRRVEVFFPIEEEALKERLINEVLWLSLHDDAKARQLMPDGGYTRLSAEHAATPLRSQERFIELAREAGLKAAPYEDAIRQTSPQRRRAPHGKPS